MKIDNIIANNLLLIEIGNRYLKIAIVNNNQIIYVKKVLTKGIKNNIISNITELQDNIAQLIYDVEFETNINVKQVAILISIGNIQIKEFQKTVFPIHVINEYFLEQYQREFYLSDHFILNKHIIYKNNNNQIIENPINMKLKQLNISATIIYCDEEIISNICLIFKNLKYKILDITYSNSPLRSLNLNILDIGFKNTKLNLSDGKIISYNFGIEDIYEQLYSSYTYGEINLSIRYGSNIDLVNTTRKVLNNFLRNITLPSILYITGAALFIPFLKFFLLEQYYIKSQILSVNLDIKSAYNIDTFANLITYLDYLRNQEDEISLFGLSLNN